MADMMGRPRLGKIWKEALSGEGTLARAKGGWGGSDRTNLGRPADPITFSTVPEKSLCSLMLFFFFPR